MERADPIPKEPELRALWYEAWDELSGTYDPYPGQEYLNYYDPSDPGPIPTTTQLR
jgi:hypothetical protein